MDRRRLPINSIPQPSPSPQPHFLAEEPPSEAVDRVLSKSSLRNLRLECFDEYVYNDLPQYLVRISDMRLYSRAELWNVFQPQLDTSSTMRLEEARRTMASSGEEELRNVCKVVSHVASCPCLIRVVKQDEIKRVLKYAIFSHRWGEDEPEFRDMPSKMHAGRQPPPERSVGYTKLRRCCDKAKAYGCDYVWSDTCCINKESSSELEEAIRSMYRWYRDAFVCIVYLAKSSSIHNFPDEPWFTRGWTLQELLAPERLRMYGKEWKPVCPRTEEVKGGSDFPFPDDKLSAFMLDPISHVTHIDSVNIRDFHARSPNLMVSTKMRWASKRKTTRIEDVAYCLLGIFDIMMPIAYGEGDRAFQRLLEAIAQRSGDPSFFAWAGPCSRYSMALPASPASYQTFIAPVFCEHHYTIQKRGIQLKLLVMMVNVVPSTHRYTVRPISTQLTIIGHIPRTSQSELNLDHSFAVGVVDFQFETSSAGGLDAGCLVPGKQYFGIFMRVAYARLGSGVQLSCRRMDTQGTLLLVECKSEYRAPLRSAIIEHTRSRFI